VGGQGDRGAEALNLQAIFRYREVTVYLWVLKLALQTALRFFRFRQ
jgi:hypothetical protein